MNHPHIVVLVAACLTLLAGCRQKKGAGDDWEAGEGARTSTVLVVEAENISDVAGCFLPFDDAEASGGRGMLVPQKGQTDSVKNGDDPKPDGSLRFKIRAAKAAKVTVWLRVKWGGGCANSFDLTVPGGMKRTVTSSTYDSWIWIKAVEGLALPAGDSTFTLGAREFDSRIDQIAISDDPNHIPQGIEKTNPNDEALLKLQ